MQHLETTQMEAIQAGDNCGWAIGLAVLITVTTGGTGGPLATAAAIGVCVGENI